MARKRRGQRARGVEPRRVKVAETRVEDKQLTREEVDALIGALRDLAEEAQAAADDPGLRTGGRPRDPELHRRVWLLARLAALTGARIHELLGLRASDVRRDGDHVKVWLDRGKRGVSGYVWIGNHLAKDLLVLARRVRGGGHLFPTSTGAPLSQQQLSRVLARAVEAAGIELGSRQTWHALRHHAAWREWERTQDLRRVQALLGHRSQATTARYLQLDERAREELVREALEGWDY